MKVAFWAQLEGLGREFEPHGRGSLYVPRSPKLPKPVRAQVTSQERPLRLRRSATGRVGNNEERRLAYGSGSPKGRIVGATLTRLFGLGFLLKPHVVA